MEKGNGNVNYREAAAANEADAAWLSVVAEKARSLRFGVIQITIHEGNIVQIDSTERTRLDTAGLNARKPKAGR